VAPGGLRADADLACSSTLLTVVDDDGTGHGPLAILRSAD
jgi:hypothetical protein